VPEKVRFKYKLEGIDSDWVDAGPRRMAYYTHLPPGQYRFRVMAMNNDGVWNEEGATFEFYLAPHFYQTSWFYALCGATLLLLVWSGYKLRLRHLERRTQELEAKVAERAAPVVEQKNQLAQANVLLEQANTSMGSILNQLSQGAVVIDVQGLVTFVNQAGEQLLGQRHEEMLGQHWEAVFPFQTQAREQLQALVTQPLTPPTKVSVEFDAPTGRRFWIEIEVHTDPRHPGQRIFFLHDVSEIYDLRRLLGDKAKFHDLVGESRAMKLVYEQIQDLAQVETTVLIQGETGTGKELVARAIHYASPRKDKPFIAVNCAGLTESLVASQLFGHRRGAFTGAIADQRGVFEAADGGTLLLDEIGDIPLNVQTSLLRVLQEKEITRLGESRPRKIDVRVIAATHHDLRREVAAGRFRQDLLYRVSATEIQLPPLRERRSDIPLLVAWFLGELRAGTEETMPDVSQEMMELLMAYPWPGNVRELKHAIEWAALRCKGPIIQAGDLPPKFAGHDMPEPPLGGLHQDERQRLLDALERAGGKRAAAARLLSMSRSTFYRRLREPGIENDE